MDVINSFFKNIKDKLTNPYFGTLILVLTIHHWELIFGIFNFDKGYNLDRKLEFVENYIACNITWKTFLWDALQAMLLMFVGYLIVVLTRSIVLFVEYRLMPYVTGKIVNKNVVLKTEYDDVVKEREQYFDQYEEQREYVRNFSKTIDEQTEQIKKKNQDLLEQTNTISETIKELDLKKKELESSEDKSNKKSQQIKGLQNTINSLEKENNNYQEKLNGFEHLYFDEENQKFYSSSDKFPPEIITKVQELKNDDRWNAFLKLGQFFEKGGSIGGELLTEMIERGLAFERGKREDLTTKGKIIYRYKNIFDRD